MRNAKKQIICSRCGKIIGLVKPTIKFNRKIILWAVAIAIGTQILGQIVSDLLFKFILKM